MYKILNQVRKLKHTSNTKRKHEKAFEKILVKNGYSKITKHNLIKKDIKEMKYKSLPKHKKSFISQPCGSQSFPDFLVIDANGDAHCVELKSSKDDKITWNSGMPKTGAIYIFSSGKHNAQTFVLGEDLWTEQEMEDQIAIRSLVDQITKISKKPNTSVSYYGRHMHNDGKKVYGHKDRTTRESNVYRMIGKKGKK